MLTFFILNGLSDNPQLQVPIFFLVLLIYLISLGGNMSILLLVCLDPQLNTPMYFFLCNLSVVNISSTTVTVHRILVIFVTGDNVVSFMTAWHRCISLDGYFFGWLCGNELILLTIMSYDRFVAICKPFHYSTVMNCRVCAGLAIFCWSFSLLQILPAMGIFSRFSCYVSNEINHFFCYLVGLMKLSCSDTSILELLMFTQGGLLSTFTPFLLTFISYSFIIATRMRMKTSTGRSKAFYTCSSHLTVVTLYYASLVCQYLTPISTTKSSKFLSLLNTAVIPKLNPFIYSLKNKIKM
ncbi:unnamed protein product [Staurois parvus]|uniref:G-protein coupled receptors family 1 profile domain-containing protein n=1 Tax=Staurois parvus TaxID=386267 RepID=A0ABN9AVQ7_9NEOB|nr:unnamed protein product [Staurois parvus]